MKKMSKKQSKETLGGGALHYHWVCNVNNFWSTRYSAQSGANSAKNSHTNKYPSHSKSVWTTSCTGNC